MAKARKKLPGPALELDIPRLMAAVEAERQRRGLTQTQVAEEHLRITYVTLCYWRRGGPSIGGNVALRIACFCNIDLRDYARTADPLPVSKKEAA